MNFAAIALASGAIAFAQPAFAQNVTADYASVTAALDSAGIPHERMEADENVVVLETGGYQYAIFFNGCDDAGKNCDSVQFYAGLDMETVPAPEAVNRYVREVRWGRVYTREGAMSLEMDLNLSEGGMPRALFLDNMRLWDLMVPAFFDFADTGRLPGE